MAVKQNCFYSPYNLKEPLETIIERLDECADFAVAMSEPVTDTQLVYVVYRIFPENGIYQ